MRKKKSLTVLCMMQLLLKQLDLNGVQAVPERHEGEAEEEAEDAPELCHQGGPGVDQLLRLHVGPVEQGHEGEHEVVGFHHGSPLLPIEGVFPAGMVGLAFFVTGLGWSGLALLLSNRAGLERAGPGWQLLTKTGLQGFSQA